MRIAALILGIIAGLCGLVIVLLAHVVFSLNGVNDAVIFLLPIGSFLGAGLALRFPGVAAMIFLGVALTWLTPGVNFITIGSLILNGISVVLLGIDTVSGIDAEKRSQPASPFNTGSSPSAYGPTGRVDYDRRKWDALVKYDQDIAASAAIVAKFGQHWLDELAASYLALNDKAYLLNIERKITEGAMRERQEEAQREGERANYREQLRREEMQRDVQRSMRKGKSKALFGQQAYITGVPLLVIACLAGGYAYYNMMQVRFLGELLSSIGSAGDEPKGAVQTPSPVQSPVELPVQSPSARIQPPAAPLQQSFQPPPQPSIPPPLPNVVTIINGRPTYNYYGDGSPNPVLYYYPPNTRLGYCERQLVEFDLMTGTYINPRGQRIPCP